MSNIFEPGCAGACSKPLDFDFTMAFQPVVDVEKNRIYAHEALVRGLNGEGARWVLDKVTPDNRYSFDQACRTKAIEMATDLGLSCRLNINFLPNAVYHPETCLKATLAAADRCNFAIENITFEFTEDERVMDREHLRGIVDTYRKYGFSNALDDFGSGYAGLTLLADFQPDIVKIDRAIVSNINEDCVRLAIVEGIVYTCQKLNMQVVAEGVETPEELGTLRAAGIHMFQGYLFAKPRTGALVKEDEIAFDADSAV